LKKLDPGVEFDRANDWSPVPEVAGELASREVEAVVAHYPTRARNHQSCREYMVKYRGLASWHNQKQPAATIARSHMPLVRQYWANHPSWDPQPGDLPAVSPGDVACVACWSNESNQDDPQAPPMLLCEACGRGFHTVCLIPPLAAVPPEDEPWFCPQCRKPGDSSQRRQ
jgi:hypothetical protein